ncbi:hypothetical protein LMG7141_00456 [Ralstonia condita]|uniref:Uncharacterized protein n=1 Tax=Ralstonia condita TaxID=3058600 RepID=A0ABM9IY56_9RALS|nr:hypothetical protein [Burkholderiaceae bacterium]CAJ0776137.1 hypothetical protein LMG7141_00456 [Ralstonia sp. LMG 7141]
MLRWIANWALNHAPSPEKQAERALNELRMELYQAEQRVLDAQMHADYYRARLTFLEEVVKKGIERVSDQRKGKQESAHALRAGLKFTAELWRESQAQPRDPHLLRRRTAMSFIDPHDAHVDGHRDPKIHHISELSGGAHFDGNVNPIPQAKHVSPE